MSPKTELRGNAGFPADAYKLTVTEEGDKTGNSTARLFRLEQELFLDLVPAECEFAPSQADLVTGLVFPGHMLMWVAAIEPETFGQLIHAHPHIHTLVSEGVFLPDLSACGHAQAGGTFLPLPNLATEPFLKLWEQDVFALLLAEGKITEEVVANMRSWRHSGFSVDQSVRLEADDSTGVQRLIQYFLRCPFSQARMIEVTEAGKVIYKQDARTTAPAATTHGCGNRGSRPAHPRRGRPARDGRRSSGRCMSRIRSRVPSVVRRCASSPSSSGVRPR